MAEQIVYIRASQILAVFEKHFEVKNKIPVLVTTSRDFGLIGLGEAWESILSKIQGDSDMQLWSVGLRSCVQGLAKMSLESKGENEAPLAIRSLMQEDTAQEVCLKVIPTPLPTR